MNHRALMYAAISSLALALPAHTAAQEKPMNTLTAEERAAGWRLLFDGTSTKGWRRYMQQTMTEGWQVVDGALTRAARGGGDIISVDKFKNFDLVFDFKLNERGNSGIFYRAIEGPDLIYYAAPEYQVLDDERHPDGQSEMTSTGSNYAINPAPRGVVKPVGEWNTGRIVVNGNHVEHWLNGQKIVDYEFGSPDWTERVAKSKFRQWPEYGKAAEGHIGIQDHGTWVAYRNVKIRPLP